MKFKGDIIITDPCYIIRAEHNGTKPITLDDWKACDYGDNMEVLGIKNYIYRGTIYGDWSCTCELKVCTTKKPENPSVFLTLPVAHELSVLCMI